MMGVTLYPFVGPPPPPAGADADVRGALLPSPQRKLQPRTALECRQGPTPHTALECRQGPTASRFLSGISELLPQQ